MKQRKLPPWLREGLEKMEREKQKKMEREEMMKRTEQEYGKEGPKSADPTKSKFVSISDVNVLLHRYAGN